MMNSKRLALATAIALALTGCMDDGDDGSSYLPTTTNSQTTQLHYIAHEYGDGQITVDFDVTDENGDFVTGLTDASLYLADYVKTGEDEETGADKFGVVLSRDGSIGGRVFVGGDEPTAGAELKELGDGRYQLIAPIASVHAGTEAIVRLQVGSENGSIALSRNVIIDQPENLYTTSSENCYACHVDYATSEMPHPHNVAYDVDGNVDFIAGCMVCHNSIKEEADGSGGYATNTMYDLGHKVHSTRYAADPENPVDKFTVGFTFSECSACHASGEYNVNDDLGMIERQALRANYQVELGTPYYNATNGYCTDIKLFDVSSGSPVQVNIAEDYSSSDAEKLIAYTGVYLNGYDAETGSILPRIITHGGHEYVDQADGTRSVCYSELDLKGETYSYLNASSRVSLRDAAWSYDDGKHDGKYGVSFTNYSNTVQLSGSAEPYTLTATDDAFDRRHIVTGDSCTTCHNHEANYHKNGSFQDGGRDCLACHNNGFDRNSKSSAPGLGPMIHSMHWGVGNTANGPHGFDEDGEPLPNKAANLSAKNCVSCHENGIDLDDVPNNYMLSRAFNNGTAGVMSSPITANCYACHSSEAALSHMETHGGEINALKPATGWFELTTAESCAVCHSKGRSSGIEKHHNFTRVIE